jgi:hypothetical protein
VIYVAAEGQFGFGTRVAAYRKRKLAAGDDDPPFMLLPSPLDLVGEMDSLLTDIAAQLDGTAPILIVLDTLNRTLAGSESRDEDMSKYIAACDRIRAKFNCAVLIVHHCGLDQTRPRGHTSVTGAADAQIAVKKGENDLIIAEVEYMKDGPDGAVFAGRRVPVVVGDDENGKSITSCVVEDVDSSEARVIGATKAGGRPAHERQLVVEALEKAIGEAGVEFHPSGSPDPVRAITIDAWRGCYYDLKGDRAKKETVKKTFSRAVDNLLNEKRPRIGVEGGQVWLR